MVESCLERFPHVRDRSMDERSGNVTERPVNDTALRRQETRGAAPGRCESRRCRPPPFPPPPSPTQTPSCYHQVGRLTLSEVRSSVEYSQWVGWNLRWFFSPAMEVEKVWSSAPPDKPHKPEIVTRDGLLREPKTPHISRYLHPESLERCLHNLHQALPLATPPKSNAVDVTMTVKFAPQTDQKTQASMGAASH